MNQLFDPTYNRYKGNLHTHTTQSDGIHPPDTVTQLYRERGYSFLAITDHRIYTPGAEQPGFTRLSGIELDNNDVDTRRAWHIVGLGMERPVGQDGDHLPPQQLAQGILDAGGLAVLAHPVWSLLSHDDMIAQQGCFATEIYSGISEGYGGRGNSSEYADTCAARGCRKLLLGVDDAHFYDYDAFQSWIVLLARSLRTADLMEALRAGRFYASEGPELVQVSWDGERVIAETSPCTRIAFYSDTFWSPQRITRGENITRGECRIQPTDHWIRVECVDQNGRRATSQYIDLGRT